jgi:hypothetical protein
LTIQAPFDSIGKLAMGLISLMIGLSARIGENLGI